jgi:hypothetical protein
MDVSGIMNYRMYIGVNEWIEGLSKRLNNRPIQKMVVKPSFHLVAGTTSGRCEIV